MELILNLESLSADCREPKYQRLYNAIQAQISTGRLEHEYRLPSSRALAETYGLSRGTVKQVYEMLEADGYIRSLRGSGTYVNHRHITNEPRPVDTFLPIAISEWGSRLPELEQIQQLDVDQCIVNFSPTHAVNLDFFPNEEWRKCTRAGLHELNYLVSADYPEPQGVYPLREAISNHVRNFRGMNVSMDDVVIVNGSVHGMALLAHLLVNPGDTVMIEDPTYPRVRNIIHAVGGKPRAIQTDETGTGFHDWSSRVVFVTPNHQYPTGKVMSYDERMKLLRRANEVNAVIVEDDIDSDFRRRGRPIAPLKTLDRDDRVIYLGTFYSTLLPNLRIGYVILPVSLKEPFLKAKNLFQPFATSLVEQMAVAQFIKSGGYDRHLRRFRRLYGLKFSFFNSLLKQHLSDGFEWCNSDTILHIFGWWKRSFEEYQEFRKRCFDKGVV